MVLGAYLRISIRIRILPKHDEKQVTFYVSSNKGPFSRSLSEIFDGNDIAELNLHIHAHSLKLVGILIPPSPRNEGLFPRGSDAIMTLVRFSSTSSATIRSLAKSLVESTIQCLEDRFTMATRARPHTPSSPTGKLKNVSKPPTMESLWVSFSQQTMKNFPS